MRGSNVKLFQFIVRSINSDEVQLYHSICTESGAEKKVVEQINASNVSETNVSNSSSNTTIESELLIVKT